MITNELLSYIKKEIEDGFNKEQISETLINSGWTATDIEEAFLAINNPTKEQAPNTTPDPTPTIPIQQETPINTPIVNETENENINNPVSTPNSTYQIPEDTEKPHKLNKLVIILIAFLVVVFIGAGSVYAYFSVFNKKLTPQEVFSRMIKASEKITTINNFENDISADSKFALSNNTYSKVNYKLTTKGNVDITNLKDIKENTNVNLQFNVSYGGFMNIDANVNADIKAIDNVLYIRLNKISKLPGSDYFNKFLGKWIKIDKNGMEDFIYKATGADSKKVEENTKKYKETAKKVTAEVNNYSKELQSIFNNSVVAQKDENINGVLTYHYVIKINKDDITTLFDEFSKILSSTSLSGNTTYTDFEKFRKSADFEKLVNMLTKVDLQIWIGKKDFLPHQVTAKLDLVNQKLATEKKNGGSEYLMASELVKVRTNAETVYNDNNNYGNNFKLADCPNSNSSNSMFSTNKNISSSIDKIRNISNDKNNGLSGAYVYCVAIGDSTGGKYAVSAVSKDGSANWCIDSNGYSGNGKANPLGECNHTDTTSGTISNKDLPTISGNLNLKYSVGSYGKPIVVDTPKDTIPINDLLGN